MQRMLFVRAGPKNELFKDFVRHGLVAVGWTKFGDLSSVQSAADLEHMLISTYPEGVTVSGRPKKHYAEIIQFAFKAKPGDFVVTVDGAHRRLLVGRIKGRYRFMDEQPLQSGGEPYRHILPIIWMFAVAREKKGPFSFPETTQKGKSTFWLNNDSVNAIMNAPRLPIDVYPRAKEFLEPRPMDDAPVNSGVDDLLHWLDENEERAEALPSDVLAAKAAAANPEARRVEFRGTVFVRDSFVAARAKQLANGICDLCGQPAPFNSISGSPYLEAHHVKWLSRGGLDALNNAVAICPNCHRKMHILNDEADIQALIERIMTRS